MASSETFNMRGSNDTSSSSSSSAQRSPWHSPVPYLFGGLAAMLGLIAFALLILACSYWKLSGFLDDTEEQRRTGENRDLESGEGKSEKTKIQPPVMEEKFLVIMAGEFKPTHLATPVLGLCGTRIVGSSSSFGEMNKTCTCDNEESEEKKDEGRNDQVHRGSAQSHEVAA